MEKTIHQGRNIKRFREMLGIKQEALAFELGDDWNQRKISLLEQKDVVEPAILEKIGKALKVPRKQLRILTKKQQSLTSKLIMKVQTQELELSVII